MDRVCAEAETRRTVVQPECRPALVGREKMKRAKWRRQDGVALQRPLFHMSIMHAGVLPPRAQAQLEPKISEELRRRPPKEDHTTRDTSTQPKKHRVSGASKRRAIEAAKAGLESPAKP